jgi:hypothetical protein
LKKIQEVKLINPVIPGVLKSNGIQGAAPGAPSMKNNEGMLLGT